MTRPRINVMIMTDGETNAPVRSYSFPWYAPRAAIIIGAATAVLLLTSLALVIYFYNESREVDELRVQMKSMSAAVEKLDALQQELLYHRDFTRRVAGLLGISVPNFEDSALAAVAGGRGGSTASADSIGDEGTDADGLGGGGTLVTDIPPDPNNRPRGLPLLGSVSRGFAPHQSNPSLKHSGIDLAAREGTPVLATADGVVEFAGEDDIFGFMIVVDHGNGFKTTYGHNSLLLVKGDEHVHRGDRIAFSGNTGISSAPHLHYEITENGVAVDPAGFLGR